MTVDQIVAHCRELTGRPLGAVAEEWKARHSGGRVVAAYPVFAPAEVLHAAGVLPLGLFGGGTSVELTHADARFQSFVCSIAKSSLELGFQDLIKGVDGLRVLQHLRRRAQPREHLPAELPRDLRRVPAPAAELHLARGERVRGGRAPAARRRPRAPLGPPGDRGRPRQERGGLQHAAGPASGLSTRSASRSPTSSRPASSTRCSAP